MQRDAGGAAACRSCMCEILSGAGCFRNDLSAHCDGAILIFRANKIVEPLSHIFHYRANASAGPLFLGCG
jgi:hypothetical protein